MFGCRCFSWAKSAEVLPSEPITFSLPSSIPDWPQGNGFATGKINLGEIEVVKITDFEYVWGCNPLRQTAKGVSFYKPIGIPDGFSTLGHYCQPNDQPLQGFLLVARESTCSEPDPAKLPALQKPLDYTLSWNPDDGNDEDYHGGGYFWLPQPPEGYKAMGYLVTNKPSKPDLEEVMCVRTDLSDVCENYRLLFTTNLKFPKFPFRVWNTRPVDRGMLGKGVSVGTFFCSGYWSDGEELYVACLKNLNPDLHAMPNIDQAHGLIKHYGPTVFFHPDEAYLPSSVSWFFENGAVLCKKGESDREPIGPTGSNLPGGETNDGKYWIDLPSDDRRDIIKCGNLEGAQLYIHVKPALGGTFTDIVMWVFCPFNGPATLKVGPAHVALNRVGQHVGDWEHFTLRISNFTGELWSMYFSQHSGGVWVEAFDLEFINGNKPIVYSSRSGHASFPHPGTYIQGSTKLGIGTKNEASRSDFLVDSSVKYEIVAAEYLGDVVSEPGWLQYMREWGPTIVYDSRTEIEKIIGRLPVMVRNSVENIFSKLPVELYGEEGPTGPKEKNNWVGDERG